MPRVLPTVDSPKRQPYSNGKKVEVLLWHEKNGQDVSSTSRYFNIARTTISGWIRKKDLVLSRANPSQQRSVPIKFDSIDQGLLHWFTQQRTLFPTFPIDQGVLLEKAKQIAQLHYPDDLPDVNLSWIGRFKLRHGICSKAFHGEAGAVQPDVVANWQDTLLKCILESYEPQDIFNVDELGLFWKLMPNKTLAFKHETCSGGKQSKERLTVLLGGSMSGEKLPLLTIGKSAKPRCFKNVRHLPVKYESNDKAWMTSILFEQYVRKLDVSMRSRGRKIALIIDNCPSHPLIKNLSNIELFFLPPNTTSKTQPMDAGVIRNFKLHYKTQLCKARLASLDLNVPFQFTVLDALRAIKSAWDSVKSDTIVHCFRHCGFVTNDTPEVDVADDEESFESFFERMRHAFPSVTSDVTSGDFLSVDDSLVTTEALSLADIAHSTVSVPSAVAEEPDSDDDDVDDVTPVPSVRSAFGFLSSLQRVADASATSSDQANLLHHHISALESIFADISASSARQSSIRDFFPRA
uniref:HTH CENPB-type domain-containing protein n=1 Tax=Plectus sambesii TaxID=2011161 RepID=A0A914UMC1_9BILA